MMKRYLVFGFERYYPGGGMNDCIGSYDTTEQAKKVLGDTDCEEGNIFDTVRDEVIYDSED